MAKSTKSGESEAATGHASPAPTYEVVGLKPTDHMPIHFDGQTYDLANLSDDQAAYLLGFPEQVPYLKAVEAAASPGLAGSTPLPTT